MDDKKPKKSPRQLMAKSLTHHGIYRQFFLKFYTQVDRGIKRIIVYYVLFKKRIICAFYLHLLNTCN